LRPRRNAGALQGARHYHRACLKVSEFQGGEILLTVESSRCSGVQCFVSIFPWRIVFLWTHFARAGWFTHHTHSISTPSFFRNWISRRSIHPTRSRCVERRTFPSLCIGK